MKKNDFQMNGNLYRRNPDGSTWANRYVSLSTDTGTMKFYVEKGGKRTLKGQVNIKQGRLEVLEQETIGRAFAFAIINESLGAVEDANISLAAPDADLFEQWKTNVELCFTIGGVRRRKSMMGSEMMLDASASMMDIPVPAPEPVVAPEPEPAPAAPAATAAPADVHSLFPAVVEEEPAVPAPVAHTPAPPLAPASVPAASVPPTESRKSPSTFLFPGVMPLDPADDTWLQPGFGNVTEEEVPTAPQTVHTPSAVTFSDTPTEEARTSTMDAFRRSSLRKSFKVPTFKNILAPKEVMDEPEPEPVPVPVPEVVHVEEHTVASTEKRFKAYNPADLKLTVRPTEMVRMGYLYKLDTTSKDIGEDSWISQYVSLSIATGILEYHAEIAGRRILRGKMDVNDSSIKTVDYVYYGRLFVFKLTRNGGTAPEDSLIFAAEEMESLSYWLVSFNDCRTHKDEKEAAAREAAAALASPIQLPEVDEDGNVRLVEDRGSYTPFARLSVSVDQGSPGGGLRTGERPAALRDAAYGPLTEPHGRQRASTLPAESAEEIDKKAMVIHYHRPSFEFPSPNPHKKPSFHISDAGISAGDLDISPRALSSALSTMSLMEAVTEINETNLDDLFKVEGGLSRVNTMHKEVDNDTKVVDRIAFKVKSVHYSAERLARRIRIWYCSSGFALTSEQEIEIFVNSLRSSDDEVLKSFAEERFDQIKDWATLLELLCKYEQKVILERQQAEGEDGFVAPKSIHITALATLPERSSTVSECVLDEHFDLEAISKQFSKDLKLSELALISRLPRVLCSKDHVWGQGLRQLNEDLTFAEDLVLYQEDVIKQMWDDQNLLKVTLGQKDDVINQLYSQLSEQAEVVNSQHLSADYAFSPLFASSLTNKQAANNNPRELQAIADREFNIADRDGDGRLTREEWRGWIADKHNLLSEHNHVKAVLMSEIRNLRKALNPNAEQTYQELAKSEEARRKQEEELVRLHIEHDVMKMEMSALALKVQELETEKSMIESDWEERYNALLSSLGNGTGKAVDNKANPYAYSIEADRAMGLDTRAMESPTSDLIKLAGAPIPTVLGGSDGRLTPNSYAFGSSPEEKADSLPGNRQYVQQQYAYDVGMGAGYEQQPSREVAHFSEQHMLGHHGPVDEPYYPAARPQGREVAALRQQTSNFADQPEYNHQREYNPAGQMYWMSRSMPAMGQPDMSNHPLRAALKNEMFAKQNTPIPGASPYTMVKSPFKGSRKPKLNVIGGYESASQRFGSPQTPGRSSSPGRPQSPQRFMQTTNSWAKKSMTDKELVGPKDTTGHVAVNWRYNLRNMKYG